MQSRTAQRGSGSGRVAPNPAAISGTGPWTVRETPPDAGYSGAVNVEGCELAVPFGHDDADRATRCHEDAHIAQERIGIGSALPLWKLPDIDYTDPVTHSAYQAVHDVIANTLAHSSRPDSVAALPMVMDLPLDKPRKAATMLKTVMDANPLGRAQLFARTWSALGCIRPSYVDRAAPCGSVAWTYSRVRRGVKPNVAQAVRALASATAYYFQGVRRTSACRGIRERVAERAVALMRLLAPKVQDFDVELSPEASEWDTPRFVDGCDARRKPIRHFDLRRGTRMTRLGVPVAAWRMEPTGDGSICRLPQRQPAATVLIDCSGSMQWRDDDLAALLRAVPAATVACYAGNEAGTGALVVVARDGWKASQTAEQLAPEMRGQNYVDLPCLEWLATQPAPRIWVSDGESYKPNARYGEGERECAEYAAAHGIERIQHAAQVLARLRRPTK